MCAKPPRGSRIPTSDRGSFDPNMLLAYLPNGLRVGNAAAAVDGTLVFETNMDGVEVFVDGTSRGVVNKGNAASLAWHASGEPYGSRREAGL